MSAPEGFLPYGADVPKDGSPVLLHDDDVGTFAMRWVGQLWTDGTGLTWRDDDPGAGPSFWRRSEGEAA